MPFMPSDGYVSHQNPPDFTWGEVDGAECYDLEIASDIEFEKIEYTAYGLEYNFFNFAYPFAEGVKLYWRARYKKDGVASEWSTPRRFRIYPGADKFAVPDIDTLMKRIPSGHPRIHTTPDELAEFRSFKDKYRGSREIYDAYVSGARANAKSGVIDPEPTFEPNEDWVVHSRLKMELYGKVEGILGKTFNSAFAYLLSGDKEIAAYAIKSLISICKWDIYGATSYKNQDQVHRSIAYKCAMAYDWLYDAMTPEERQTVLDMIRARTKVMEGLISRLKRCPYDSHAWTAFGYIGIIAVATHGEIPESDAWLRQIIQQYTVVLPPWSYQDGGWCQGTGYWQYSTEFNKEFFDVLRNAGILDLYAKTWQKNEHLWSLYAFPQGVRGSFGDGSCLGLSGNYNKRTLYRDAYYLNSGKAKTLAVAYGQNSNDFFNYRVAAIEELPAEPLDGMQLSHAFRDIGWITMSDQTENYERILLTFKSSPYGSFNHSHADQNSFVLHAYGSTLAINSGYYDAYHSKHDSGFTRKTHAHNSITLSGKGGQKDDDMFANGRLTSYLTHPSFDLAGGDASSAYRGKLKKYQRNIIYVRPEIFVVIDDLEANDGEREEFLWWLNAFKISLGEKSGCAKVSSETAELDAEILYPEVVGKHIPDFRGDDGIEYPPQLATGYKVHQRVCFKTEKTDKTKIVTILGVHRNSAPAHEYKCERIGDCLKISFAEEKTVYVNLGDNDSPISIDGYEFVGKAVAAHETSVMLAEGSSLKFLGKTVLEFEKTASAVLGLDELCVATLEDNKITVGTQNPFLSEAKSIEHFDKTAPSSASGVTEYRVTEGEINLSLDADFYEFMLGGKRMGQKLSGGVLKLSVDGKDKIVDMSGRKLRNGKELFTFFEEISIGKYKIVSKNDELSVRSFVNGEACSARLDVFSSVPENTLELETVEIKECKMSFSSAYDEVKAKLDSFCEAEDFVGRKPNAVSVYTNRPFLSGGKGVMLLNELGDKLCYDVDIPEDGNYDFVIKYVAWNPNGAEKVVDIDRESFKITLASTPGWGSTPEQWCAARAEISKPMKKGKHSVYLEALVGEWNIDWFGFIRK